MMKMVCRAGVLALLLGFSGCSQEAEVDRAADEVIEERQETREEMRDAADDVLEETEETREAELELQQEQRELMEQ